MEVKEATEYLKKAQVYMARSMGMSANRPLYKAFMLAIFALEKQIPKKPITDSTHYAGFEEFLCPSCKKRIISRLDGDWLAGRLQKYCDECGQALDWSDV